MIFTIFASIVFVAELVIAFALINCLVKLDIKVNNANKYIIEANPKIKSIMLLVKQISEQILELAPTYVDKIKEYRNKIILAKATSLMTSFFFLGINIKTIKKIRKSKAFKLAWKGLSFIENMV